MASIVIPQEVKDILSRVDPGEEDIASRILIRGLKDLLRECEQEILDLEIKHGCSFDEFKQKLEGGELGNQFGYPIENDAMIWEDLVAEKKLRLEAIRSLERIA